MKYEVTLIVDVSGDYTAEDVNGMILWGVCHCKKIVVWDSKSKKV